MSYNFKLVCLLTDNVKKTTKNSNGHGGAWEFILESREVVKNATNVFVRSFAMGKTSNRSQNRSLVAEIESFECRLLAEDTTSYSS